MTVGIADPKPDGALGGSFGRSLKDDQVKALAQFYVAYDNLGHITAAQSDHLARLVTGESAQDRALDTNGELSSITYRRTGVFTGLTLPGNLQPDALERIIPIELDRIPDTDRRTEEDLWAAWHRAHPRILGALLIEVRDMLDFLHTAAEETSGQRPRMADDHTALHSQCPLLADTYKRSASATLADAADADPFVQALINFLRREGRDAGSAAPPNSLTRPRATPATFRRTGARTGGQRTDGRSARR